MIEVVSSDGRLLTATRSLVGLGVGTSGKRENQLDTAWSIAHFEVYSRGHGCGGTLPVVVMRSERST
jgi:hypothetical protein